MCVCDKVTNIKRVLLAADILFSFILVVNANTTEESSTFRLPSFKSKRIKNRLIIFKPINK